MQRMGNMLAALFNVPHTMSPDEIEDRVEMLEMKVESNQVALEQHKVDLNAHQGDGVNEQ